VTGLTREATFETLTTPAWANRRFIHIKRSGQQDASTSLLATEPQTIPASPAKAPRSVHKARRA